MPTFLSIQPYGLLILNEKGKVIKFQSFPKDPDSIAKILGNRDLLGEYVDRLISSRRDKGDIVVNDQLLKDLLDMKGVRSIISSNEKPFLKVRREYLRYASQVWGGIDESEYYLILNRLGIRITKQKIKEELSSLDHQIIKSIDYIDHANKALNILAPAIREWYSIHFPELNDLIEEHPVFMKIVSLQPDRRKMSEDALKEAGVSGSLARSILNAAKESMGADFDSKDLEVVRKVADNWISLYESRKDVESFIENLMRRKAPNLSSVVHPLVGARLIAVAGGLKRLASLPASSIQILGAHKAIFMHLVKGAKPPKHGILFQAKEVRTAPKKLRGKIARLLATKIAVAARVDAFGRGRYIGDELRKEIDRRLKEIIGGGKQ